MRIITYYTKEELMPLRKFFNTSFIEKITWKKYIIDLKIDDLLDIYLFFQKWENVDLYFNNFRKEIDDWIKSKLERIKELEDKIKEIKEDIRKSKWIRKVMNKNDINLLIKYMYEESIEK